MKARNTVLKKTAIAVTLGIVSLQFAHAADITRDNGSPVGDNENSQTAGPEGPVLLQDSHLIEKLQRFDRKRIPDRAPRSLSAFHAMLEKPPDSAFAPSRLVLFSLFGLANLVIAKKMLRAAQGGNPS